MFSPTVKNSHKKKKEFELHNILYDSRKFNQFHPPKLIFLPSKGIMKKMMRVAVEAKDVFDLYYIF
jgi:hypothetical protein